MTLTYEMLNEDFGSIKTNNKEYIIVNCLPWYDILYKG